jgi:hypothetical protein
MSRKERQEQLIVETMKLRQSRFGALRRSPRKKVYRQGRKKGRVKERLGEVVGRDTYRPTSSHEDGHPLLIYSRDPLQQR